MFECVQAYHHHVSKTGKDRLKMIIRPDSCLTSKEVNDGNHFE